MNENWDADLKQFIALCEAENAKLLMVGGGAVNFHGYKRHSADVDFWIDTSEDNFSTLAKIFSEMGYQVDDFPEKVKTKEQNISVKFSPASLNLELITNFSSDISFPEAYERSIKVSSGGVSWRVLCYEDLIESKLKSQRPKDLLDIQELQRIRNVDK